MFLSNKHLTTEFPVKWINHIPFPRLPSGHALPFLPQKTYGCLGFPWLNSCDCCLGAGRSKRPLVQHPSQACYPPSPPADSPRECCLKCKTHVGPWLTILGQLLLPPQWSLSSLAKNIRPTVTASSSLATFPLLQSCYIKLIEVFWAHHAFESFVPLHCCYLHLGCSHSSSKHSSDSPSSRNLSKFPSMAFFYHTMLSVCLGWSLTEIN